MNLRTLLIPVADYQKVTIVASGACITAPAWAWFKFLSDALLDLRVEIIAVEGEEMKVWLENND